MRKTVMGLCVVFLVFLMPLSVSAALYDEYEQKASITFENLEIVSFSDRYDEKAINELYQELLNNFHSKELGYLNAIYLYPDSPEGVAGNYYEDIMKGTDGNYYIGNEAYIELFNMDLKSILDIAPALSHEYGHHYTLCNMIEYENKYYSDWKDSEYANIRSLIDYPVSYDFSDDDYSYAWDVVEIAASDYVQLLGSKNAKTSWIYKDAEQMLEQDVIYEYSPIYYNMRPQENYELPIATDVNGLWDYLHTIGNHEAELPELVVVPEIKNIISEDSFMNKKYTINWDEAKEGVFEHTVVMYPSEFPFMAMGLKTVSGNESMNAVFGTVTKQGEDGDLLAITDYYVGEYTFVVYAKDLDGFIFASEPFTYDFGQDYFDVAQYYDNNEIEHESERTKEEVLEIAHFEEEKFLYDEDVIYINAESVAIQKIYYEKDHNNKIIIKDFKNDLNNLMFFKQFIPVKDNDFIMLDKAFDWNENNYMFYNKSRIVGVCYLRQNIPIIRDATFGG